MPHNNNLADAIHAEVETPRRLALKQIAALVGLTLTAQSLDVLAKPRHHAILRGNKFLSSDELQMTGEIADLIIPATDTPGALATNVHGFIDIYLADCVSPADQHKFIAGLKKINAISEDVFHKTFIVCTHSQHIQMLKAIENHHMGFNSEDHQFFKFFKSLTLLGYYTSEVGATQELAYLAIPGGYKGDFPFSKIGKAWSLN